MNLALDAMGGDNAPREIVLGALEAAPHLRRDVLLVGLPEAIERFLPAQVPENLRVVSASQVVEMDEKPMEALRLKKDSSLAVAAGLVKKGEAGAMISAGNTGAATACSLLSWRQVAGVHRPAIGSHMPNQHDGFLLLDSGASPDVEPEHLVEFAKMGRAYVSRMWNRKNPGVHLINIGEEPGKGNAFAKQAHCLLAEHEWFRGNIEGKDMFSSPCDVVVCDAFVGNVILKTSEGVGELISRLVKAGIPKHPIPRSLYWPVRRVMAPLRKAMDYAETGGSPLLGLNGLCMIAHGRSNARAIKNALLLAQHAIEAEVVGAIRESFAVGSAAQSE